MSSMACSTTAHALACPKQISTEFPVNSPGLRLLVLFGGPRIQRTFRAVAFCFILFTKQTDYIGESAHHSGLVTNHVGRC